jgi:hypothetical protein
MVGDARETMATGQPRQEQNGNFLSVVGDRLLRPVSKRRSPLVVVALPLQVNLSAISERYYFVSLAIHESTPGAWRRSGPGPLLFRFVFAVLGAIPSSLNTFFMNSRQNRKAGGEQAPPALHWRRRHDRLSALPAADRGDPWRQSQAHYRSAVGVRGRFVRGPALPGDCHDMLKRSSYAASSGTITDRTA